MLIGVLGLIWSAGEASAIQNCEPGWEASSAAAGSPPSSPAALGTLGAEDPLPSSWKRTHSIENESHRVTASLYLNGLRLRTVEFNGQSGEPRVVEDLVSTPAWHLTLADQVGRTMAVHQNSEQVLAGGKPFLVEITTSAGRRLTMHWPLVTVRAGESWPHTTGLVIVDEAHHIAASTFHQIVDRCPARYRLGLTATPEREDGLTPLLKLFLGPPLIDVPHGRLVEAGVLTLPEIQIVETDFQFPYRSAEDYPAMMKALARDEGRNTLICQAVELEARAGHLCLVLSGRVAHCHHIANWLRERGIQAQALTSKVPKDRRPVLLEQARSGELQVLVATSLADEGLDLPRLSRVFLAFPSKAKGRTTQRIGRLMRPHPDKDGAVLYDFVDRKVPALRRQHLARRKLYAELIGVPASNLCPTSPLKPAFDL